MHWKNKKINPCFIVPLIFDGSFGESIPTSVGGVITSDIKDILCADFTSPVFSKFAENMVALKPMGLIPRLFGLERDFGYAQTVKLWEHEKNL